MKAILRVASFNRWEKVIIFGIAVILVAGFGPYKRACYNVLDVLTLSLLALLFQMEFVVITGQFSKWFFGLVCVLGFLPLLYFIILVSKHLFACLIGWHHFQQKWTALQQYCVWMKRQSPKLAEERELPDRILHPDLYDSQVGGKPTADRLCWFMQYSVMQHIKGLFVSWDSASFVMELAVIMCTFLEYA